MPRSSDVRARLIARLQAKGTYRRWVLVTTLVGLFSTSFPVTILAVSIGDIAADFEVSETLIAWVISAPMLASAVALPVFGKMGDLYGQRRVFLTGFAAAILLAGTTVLAWVPLMLIGLRTLTQMVGSATQPTSMALIIRVFPAEERVKAMGWWSLVGAGAPAVGLAIGGPLIEAIGWRALFGVQAVLSLIPFAAAALVLEESPTHGDDTHFDGLGAAALAISAGGLMLALNQSADWGWTHPAVIMGAAIAPFAAMAFVRFERRTPYPLLPLELLARRNFTTPLTAEFFAAAAYMGGFVMTPLLLRSVLGWNLASVAFLMLLRPLTFSLSSPVGGHIGSRIGERRAVLIGLTFLVFSMVMFTIAAWSQTVLLLAFALVVQGMSFGISRPSLTATLANSVDERDLGMASASQRMLHQIGNAFGITVLTAVYAGTATAGAFARAYALAGVLALASLAIATRLLAPVHEARRQLVAAEVAADISAGDGHRPFGVTSPSAPAPAVAQFYDD